MDGSRCGSEGRGIGGHAVEGETVGRERLWLLVNQGG